MRALLTATLLTLASCATSEEAAFDARAQQRADSIAQANWHTPLPAPRIKAKGPVTVIYQIGSPGATASPQQQDNRKAGQGQGTAAIGDGTTANNQSQRTGGGVPWWVWGLVAAAGAAAWEWLSHQLPLGWLRWRARTLPLVQP